MTEPTSNQPPQRFARPRQGRMIAGVCAAIARGMNIDVGIVRLVFVISLVFGGLGLVAYVAGWALLPEEGEEKSAAERMFGS